MASHILSILLPCSPEVIVTIGEADEPVTLGFRGPLISDDPGLLYRRVLRECLEQRFVCDFAGEIPYEDPEMGRIPF